MPFTIQTIVTSSDLEFNVKEVNFGYCTVYERVYKTIQLHNKSVLPQKYGFVSAPQVRFRYLTFPKFRVTVIFAQKRCAEIKPTTSIFAHDECAKIKTREIRFFQGVRKLNPVCPIQWAKTCPKSGK